MDNIFEHKPILEVRKIFESAQETHSNERLLKQLFNIFTNNNHSTFILEFLQCLAVFMTHMEKQLNVERVLDFAAKYCIYHSSLVDEDNNVLLLAVFEFIFNNHNKKTPAIRFRTCEFVNRLLNKMGPQAALDDDIFHKMSKTMLERLQDKLPSVRAQAVMALQRLQDPPNKHCQIIRAFIFHMEADPSCEVRTKIVASLALTQRTLPLIFERLQDVRETVRKEAYRTLTRVKPRKFSILQRQTILKTGLSDKSDSVKSFIIGNVIPNWFKLCESNLVDFLKMLDVVSFKKETLTEVLSHIFVDIAQSELIKVVERLESNSEGERLIPIEELSPESATIWASVVGQVGFEAADSVILPELSFFAKYIKRYCEKVDLKDTDHQYTLTELLEIAKLYSFMDEMGRKELINTCLDLLKSDKTGAELIPPLVPLLELLIPDAKKRMVVMAELISDIREPLESYDVLSPPPPEDVVESIAEGMAHLNCTLQSQSLDECSRTERADPETMVKCLSIVVQMLKSPSVKKIDETLLSLKEHVILRCFKIDDSRVQKLALDALALLCYLSLDLAKEYFLKFCIQITDDTTCITAMEAVFDLIIIHGFDAFSFGWDYDNSNRMNNSKNFTSESLKSGGPLNFDNDRMIKSQTTRQLVSLLTNLINSNVTEVKCKASEGLYKLLLSSRLDSYILLSHLIILWFSSASDSEPHIRQPLGLFFSVFSKRPGASEMILLAFSPTLHAIEELVNEEIESMKVANLFITLLRADVANKPQEGEGSYQARLASIILEEIRREVIQQQVLTKALSSLQLKDSDAFMAEELEDHAQKVYKWLRKRSSERRTLNIIAKFKEEMAQLKEKVNDIKDTVEEAAGEPEQTRDGGRTVNGEQMEEGGIEDEGNSSPQVEESAVGGSPDDFEASAFSEDESESSMKKNNRRKMDNEDSVKIVEESFRSPEESDSEDIVSPSPPKRRMLRSQMK